MYVCLLFIVHVCMFIYVYNTYVRVHVFICMYVCMYIRMCISVVIHICRLHNTHSQLMYTMSTYTNGNWYLTLMRSTDLVHPWRCVLTRQVLLCN